MMNDDSYHADTLDGMPPTFGSLEDAHRRIKDLEINLKEMHHRIKNQLQMISGLLNLHAMQTESPDCADKLREAMGSVACVAELHQQLSQGDCSDTVDCGQYFNALATSLRRSYALPDSVVLEMHAPDKTLDAKLLSSAGVVAAELVTNAVRHAFPAGRPGHISVDLVPGQHTLTLIVQDDGVGLPSDLDPAKEGGLGFEIIRSMARQWDGRMVVSSDSSGTTATVSLAMP